MRMKQITAANMQEALQVARRELGEDAVLLDTKKATGKSITVIFAVEEQHEPIWDDLPELPVMDDLPLASPAPADIKRASAAKVEIAHPAYEILSKTLQLHAVPTSLRETILTHARSQHIPTGALLDVTEAILAEALAHALVFKPIGTGAPIPPARALMLIGPHGAGKTTAIAKLATEITLHQQRLVLVSTDTERMGAIDTLSELAAILKCPCHIAEDRATLKDLVKQYVGQAWLLIDSAGVNIYEFKQLKALGELAGLQGIEPILTCPAGLDPTEAQEMAGVFNFLAVERMIITRMDAARRLASMFTTLNTGGYGLANMSSAASPSEACLPLSAHALARLMLRHARDSVH